MARVYVVRYAVQVPTAVDETGDEAAATFFAVVNWPGAPGHNERLLGCSRMEPDRLTPPQRVALRALVTASGLTPAQKQELAEALDRVTT